MELYNLITQYGEGERESAWRSIAVLRESSLTDGELVALDSLCDEVIDRSLHNLGLIRDQLLKMGYEFQNPNGAIRLASEESVKAIAEVEGSLGKLPRIARKWYQRIDYVDFRQKREQLLGVETNDLSPVTSLGLNTPLVFRPLRECVKLHDELVSESESEGTNITWLRGLLPLGAFASNSNPKGFHLPSSQVDDILYNEGFGNVLFVEELRIAFKWGGFPRWASLVTGRRQRSWRTPTGHQPQFAMVFDFLTKDLMPI